VLRETVERWNSLCGESEDKDHKRPPKTMMPIKNGPFYVMEGLAHREQHPRRSGA